MDKVGKRGDLAPHGDEGVLSEVRGLHLIGGLYNILVRLAWFL